MMLCSLCGTRTDHGTLCRCGGVLLPCEPLPEDQDFDGEWLLQTDSEYPESFDEYD